MFVGSVPLPSWCLPAPSFLHFLSSAEPEWSEVFRPFVIEQEWSTLMLSFWFIYNFRPPQQHGSVIMILSRNTPNSLKIGRSWTILRAQSIFISTVTTQLNSKRRDQHKKRRVFQFFFPYAKAAMLSVGPLLINIKFRIRVIFSVNPVPSNHRSVSNWPANLGFWVSQSVSR